MLHDFIWCFYVLNSFLLLLLLSSDSVSSLSGDIIYAVNCGSNIPYTDSYGVRYHEDTNDVGIASDFGKRLRIGRVENEADHILYQTERYHTETFGYDIPITSGPGRYLLILKFCEVYFDSNDMKVFDIVLNGDIPIASDLDIHATVGRGVAHDIYVEFEVVPQQNDDSDSNVNIHGLKLIIDDFESELIRDHMRVEFIKSFRDNPKINAIVLMKGNLSDWPMLPEYSISYDSDDMYVEEEGDEPSTRHTNDRRKISKKSSFNENFEDYEFQEFDSEDDNEDWPSRSRDEISDDSIVEDDTLYVQTSAMLPVFVAVAAFIPLLFCMCKL